MCWATICSDKKKSLSHPQSSHLHSAPSKPKLSLQQTHSIGGNPHQQHVIKSHDHSILMLSQVGARWTLHIEIQAGTVMLIIKQDHIRWSDSDSFVSVGDSCLFSHTADAAMRCTHSPCFRRFSFFSKIQSLLNLALFLFLHLSLVEKNRNRFTG